jgi:hypothetical protein
LRDKVGLVGKNFDEIKAGLKQWGGFADEELDQVTRRIFANSGGRETVTILGYRSPLPDAPVLQMKPADGEPWQFFSKKGGPYKSSGELLVKENDPDTPLPLKAELHFDSFRDLKRALELWNVSDARSVADSLIQVNGGRALTLVAFDRNSPDKKYYDKSSSAGFTFWVANRYVSGSGQIYPPDTNFGYINYFRGDK